MTFIPFTNAAKVLGLNPGVARWWGTNSEGVYCLVIPDPTVQYIDARWVVTPCIVLSYFYLRLVYFSQPRRCKLLDVVFW